MRGFGVRKRVALRKRREDSMQSRRTRAPFRVAALVWCAILAGLGKVSALQAFNSLFCRDFLIQAWIMH
jgi:hypothetical protein